MSELQTLEHACRLDLKGNFSASKNKKFLILSDTLSFFVAALIGSVTYFSSFNFFDFEINNDTVTRAIVFSSVTFLSIAWFWGSKRHYTYRKPFWDELRESYITLSSIALIDLALTTFVALEAKPMVWLITWSSLFVILPLFRACTKYYLNLVGSWAMPSVIIGDEKNANEAYLAIRSEPSTGFRIDAFIAPKYKVQKATFVDDIPYLSPLDFLQQSESVPFKIFIALEKNQTELRDEWFRTLAKMGISNISVVPDLRGVPLVGMDVSHFFSHEVMMLRIRNNLARKSSQFIKRLFDIFVSSALLLVLAPFFGYISYKVTRDGGSATYGHERIGYKGKPFKCLKFRSMVMNSKEVLEQLLATDPIAKAEWDKEFKLKHDPRVTPTGAFLRRTSLDELPQLWNVLKGEMSLVGPRPIIDEELQRYKEDVAYYLMAKPGMSGLWQVSGRSDTDYETRVYLDAWYVKNWSLWSDIVILFKTVGVVLKRDGAY
ncbi:undecaprenyl-phosphate galactose phosphotransferase WbaP [Vibrio hippocampi]|uniref:Bacterial sugar transferase domain-containing protein n=1 Tax=Vibrio hippocampi TaxID=654686 RepID=A0ABN8DKS5_9VIBR|nr:undecaprenyl-phosphate galactose phosphotransferase WbaP [Vibrio hippocampi]CAH0527265.1 hypothetical protein VHP8226_02593 [Vibrio hippocampi]